MQSNLYVEPATSLIGSIVCTVVGVLLLAHGIVRLLRDRQAR